MNAFVWLALGIGVGALAYHTWRSGWLVWAQSSLLALLGLPGRTKALATRSPGVELDFEIQPLIGRQGGNSSPVEIGPEIRSGIDALLRSSPSILQSAKSLATRAFTLRFSGEITRGLADGKFTVMASRVGGLRGNVLDSKGMIVAQASLDAVGRSTAIVAAVWQVMAIITAQKFLADIDSKLAAIQRGLGELGLWMAEERLGKLQGNLDYLHQIAQSSVEYRANHSQLIANQLEAIQRESLQSMAMTNGELQRALEDVQACRLRGTGFGDNLRSIHDILDRYERAAHHHLLGAYVRAAAIQVRAAIPQKGAMDATRPEALLRSMEEFTLCHSAFLGTLDGRKGELGSWLTFGSTEREEQGKLAKRHENILNRFRPLHGQVKQTAETLESRIVDSTIERGRPLQLVARLDERHQLIGLERITTE